jgi:endonuclease YncB( thermonuclease family)
MVGEQPVDGYGPAVADDDTRRTRRPGRWSVPLGSARRLSLAAMVVASFAIGCAAGEGTGADDPGPSSLSSVASTTPGPTSTSAPVTSSVPPTAAPTTAPASTVVGSSVSVVAVIDGDTIDVSGGARVRLIGIDTPEVGQCGYEGATAVLRQLVGGSAVTLVPGASDDRDRYGRLLRYVEANGVDVNLMMLLSGRAVARYDSRDGYGRHPREDAYVAADLANPSANVCGGPAPATTLAPSAPSGTDPRFGSCREATANGYGPYVAGQDPEYGWYRDGDGDGVNCE